MRLSDKLRKCLSSDTVRLPLAIELGISYNTLYRWLYQDQEKFATLKNIEAITRVTGLTQDEMFEKEETHKS